MQMKQKRKQGESALLCMFFMICLVGVSSFFWRLITGQLFAGQVNPSLEPYAIIPVLLLGAILLPIAFYSLQKYNDSSAIFKMWFFKTATDYKQQNIDRKERQERIREEWKERRDSTSRQARHEKLEASIQHSIICPACRKSTFNDLIPTLKFIRCDHCENLIQNESYESQ